MLKVLLIAGQLGGGGAERQLALFLEHAEGRFEPSCFLLNEGGTWQEPVRDLCARFQVARWKAPPGRALEFARLVKNWRPDLIHCWHEYPFVYPLVSRALHRRPIVVNVRGNLTVSNESGRAGFPLQYRMLRSVDYVIANSRYSLAALERRGVVLPASRVIRNGIEPSGTRPHRPHGDVTQVIGVGSLRPLKNWSQLIRVCGQLIRSGQSLNLTIYGDGTQREQLECLCSRFGLDPRSTLPGYVPDLRRRMAEGDILVHCSRSEGLPNVILEALAEGLAVVASDLEICRELQRESGCLELFPVDDDEALQRKLEQLLANPDLWQERSEPGRAFVRRNFDCDEMARRYLEVYATLSGRPANPCEQPGGGRPGCGVDRTAIKIDTVGRGGGKWRDPEEANASEGATRK